MSFTRNRNRLCLSLDNPSSNMSASSSTIHLNRWSEVVPPKASLTFAALWDPDEGMVTFSGAALLEPENQPGRLHDVFDDDKSQYISVDRDTDGVSENTATLATFHDAFKAFTRRASWDSREHLNTKMGQGATRGLQTRASSTFDGLDVYSHDIHLKSRRSLQLSRTDLLDVETSFRTPSAFGKLGLRSDLMLDSYHSESESESSSGRRTASYLKSRFSTTTTSTSNYVDVTASAAQSVELPDKSPPPSPDIPDWRRTIDSPGECVSPAGSWPYLPRRRRLLRKRRPWDTDASSTADSTPCTPRKMFSSSIFASPSSVFASPSSVFAPPSSPSPTPSPSSTRPGSARVYTSRGRFALSDRRSRFQFPIGRRSPTPTPTPTPTPPDTPSKSVSSGLSSARLRLRFAFHFPRRRRRQRSADSEGWVCIEVTPTLSQRFIPDGDQEQEQEQEQEAQGQEQAQVQEQVQCQEQDQDQEQAQVQERAQAQTQEL